MDTSLIGNVAAEMMEMFPDEAAGEIVEVGIVVIVDQGDEGTFTRVKCSSGYPYRMVGIFQDALDTAKAPDASEGE